MERAAEEENSDLNSDLETKKRSNRELFERPGVFEIITAIGSVRRRQNLSDSL
jgi:hypothetical protein